MYGEVYFKYNVGLLMTAKGSEVLFFLKAVHCDADGVRIPSLGIANLKFCISGSVAVGAAGVSRYAMPEQ